MTDKNQESNQSSEENALKPKKLSKKQLDHIAVVLKKVLNKPKPPRAAITPNGLSNHPDTDSLLYSVGLAECFSTLENNIINTLLNQLINFTGKEHLDSPIDDAAVNTALAFLNEIKPQDTIEAMLAVQMLATHKLSITCMQQMFKRGGLLLSNLIVI